MNNIKLFESKQVRTVWNEADQKWYFSIADVIQALTDTINVKDYIKKMRKRDPELNSNWGTFCPPLEMMAPDGKRRKTQCANAENVLRIIQSIPSSNAEPFKRWLARVGYERLEEIENPELAAQRMRELYKAKGYSDEWIEKRVRGIAIRDELTNEWVYTVMPEGFCPASMGYKAKSTSGFRPEELRNDNLLILSCRKGSVRYLWV
jgi:molybdopterin/thiamine biosynthesis adenylyltransferase